MNKLNEHTCTKCNFHLTFKVHAYSLNLFGYGLCVKCQKWYTNTDGFITKQSKKLFLALRNRGVNLEIEKYDGHKHIDLAITGQYLRLNIEVDGLQHYHDASQSINDLKRTFHSLEKGFYTIRIPNMLIDQKLEETADCIVDILMLQSKPKPNLSINLN
jgi:very-short-patch-repair endonuclease